MTLQGDDCNCDLNGVNKGGKGVTLWGTSVAKNIHLAPYGEEGDGTYLAFTGTCPRCYQEGSASLLSWDVLIDSDCEDDDVQIDYYLNCEPPDDPLGTSVHSKTRHHDITEIVDISQRPSEENPNELDDDGYNTLLFKNQSPVWVWINNLRLIRVYGMCNLQCEEDEYCDGSDCPGASPACLAYVDTGATGDWDSTREDYPCNTDTEHGSCGNRYSFTKFGPNSQGTRIEPGSSFTWTFQNPLDNADNYVGSNFTPKPLTKLSFYLSVFVICHALPVYVSSHDLSSYQVELSLFPLFLPPSTACLFPNTPPTHSVQPLFS